VRRLLPLALALLLPVLVVACGGGTTEDTAPEEFDTGAMTDTGGGETTDTGGGETTETNGEDDGGGGGGAEGDPEAGAEVYASAGCGNCHVFEAAGSAGSVGPNLDESDIDYEGAEQQIRNGGGGMPAYEGQLSDEEIANVAAFVSQDSR
jgi:cytochrome c551